MATYTTRGKASSSKALRILLVGKTLRVLSN